MYSLIFIIISSVSLTLANYRDFADFTPQTYPDSMKDPFSCNILEPGFLCDPSEIIPADQKLNLMHKLVQAQNKTHCACREMGIGRGCDSAKLGYIFSIAVVNKMKLNPDEHSNDQVYRAASVFANTLREQWNRGHCGDDIVIFYSKSDNVLYDAQGPAVQVDQEKIKKILKDGEYLIKKQKYEEAFTTIIDNYINVLNGQKLNLKHKWYSPLPLWVVIVIGVIVGLILIAAITLAIFLIVNKCCRRDARGNYTPASRL
ncbi:unnamed protein product [Auanema sp. JU1783]|nr:unnamed protein product [Auanema sp. JU1783]